MNIQENILLKNYTTFKLGGPADYFVEASSIHEAHSAIHWAKRRNLAILAIGAGSNLVVADTGWRGLVLKLNLQKLEFKDNKVKVGAGVSLAYLLNQALDHGLTGLEFTAGIPGTVGGAVRGNAGTYGQAMADVLENIRYFDANYQLQDVKAADAHFAYRHSLFKEVPSIVLEVDIVLDKSDTSAARKLVAERLQYRQDTQPNEPSAGCIFKNIEFSQVDPEALQSKGVEIDKFVKNQKIPAAYLIEKAGLKGHTIGGAQVSAKHANYIINTGTATAEQVIMLISFIKQQIRDKYGVQLQEEVQLII